MGGGHGRRGFDPPDPGRFHHAAEQLSLCATTTEAQAPPVPALPHEKSRGQRRPTHRHQSTPARHELRRAHGSEGLSFSPKLAKLLFKKNDSCSCHFPLMLRHTLQVGGKG